MIFLCSYSNHEFGTLLDMFPWKIPWLMEWQTTSMFLPREFHGAGALQSMESESDMTEQLTLSLRNFYCSTSSNVLLVCTFTLFLGRWDLLSPAKYFCGLKLQFKYTLSLWQLNIALFSWGAQLNDSIFQHYTWSIKDIPVF